MAVDDKVLPQNRQTDKKSVCEQRERFSSVNKRRSGSNCCIENSDPG